jgi:hypothetical protein
MSDVTIIYYTSNCENKKFEYGIRRELAKSIRRKPLISVSQVPIRFGKNICVGIVGRSNHNALRQMQLGALEATTKYVSMAESDTLYPQDLFDFVPPSDDTFYIAKPFYVLFNQRGSKRVYAEKPKSSESAMVVNRDFLLSRMEEIFSGKEQWDVTHQPMLVYRKKIEFFAVSYPVVSFKTDQNMHRKAPHDTRSYCLELPHWGNVHKLIKEYSF